MTRTTKTLVAVALAVCLVVLLSGCGKAATNEPEVTVKEVPTVTGMSQAAAASVLKKAGFAVGTVTKAPYPAGAPAVVITQDPAAQSPMPAGTKVDLVVAQPAK